MRELDRKISVRLMVLNDEDAGENALGVHADQHFDRSVIAALKRFQFGSPEHITGGDSCVSGPAISHVVEPGWFASEKTPLRREILLLLRQKDGYAVVWPRQMATCRRRRSTRLDKQFAFRSAMIVSIGSRINCLVLSVLTNVRYNPRKLEKRNPS
jgi:hypothetical protein